MAKVRKAWIKIQFYHKKLREEYRGEQEKSECPDW